MNIVIFSDIHANLIALKRFIEETRYIGDKFICLGDIVNYGPWNDECIDLIFDLPNIEILEGNHERLFLGLESVEEEIPLVQLFTEHSKKYFSQVEKIKNLSQSIRLDNYLCQHTIENKSIYPDTIIQVNQNYIIGHSHHQYILNSNGYNIINPGSVGQNRSIINLVNYGIYNTKTEQIKLYSTKYNFNSFISELKKRNYPKECITYYVSKRTV